jgi:conjugative transposon TraJ protein
MCRTKIVMIVVLAVVPGILMAQSGGLPDDIHSLQAVLGNIYKEMIPLCRKLINVGRAIAGFAATWYIAARVWKHIARAEPVDFYPLFRPFALGMVITAFPYVIALIDGVLSPTVIGTNEIVKESSKSIQTLLDEKEKAIRNSDTWKALVGESGEGDRDLWLKYAHPDAAKNGEKWYEKIGYSIQFSLSRGYYSFKNSVKQMLAEILQILYEAAALCINTIRTFNMIVLAIIGPLVCAIAVFDGFQHTLVVWLARYINVYLWLPVANIFSAITSKIMENMIKIDIDQINLTGDTFFSSADIGYIIFMIIAIVGYTTVPNVANSIVNVGDRSALSDKISRMVGSSVSTASATVGMASAGMIADSLVDAGRGTSAGYANAGTAGGYFGGGSDHARKRIGG